MSDAPVNLNRFRKTKARAAKKARADQNAVLRGLPKAAKEQAKAETARKHRFLNGNELLTKDDTP